MTRSKKLSLTVLIALAGVLAIAAWSESTATAVLSAASLDHARTIAGKANGPSFRQIERDHLAVRSSLAKASVYSVGIAVLTFASIALLWIPRRASEENEPNKAPEPTPGAVTSRAD